MKEISLEVGKTYRTADGDEVVTIISRNGVGAPAAGGAAGNPTLDTRTAERLAVSLRRDLPGAGNRRVHRRGGGRALRLLPDAGVPADRRLAAATGRPQRTGSAHRRDGGRTGRGGWGGVADAHLLRTVAGHARAAPLHGGPFTAVARGALQPRQGAGGTRPVHQRWRRGRVCPQPRGRPRRAGDSHRSG